MDGRSGLQVGACLLQMFTGGGSWKLVRWTIRIRVIERLIIRILVIQMSVVLSPIPGPDGITF